MVRCRSAEGINDASRRGARGVIRERRELAPFLLYSEMGRPSVLFPQIRAPVSGRIRIGIPAGGLGQRLDLMNPWWTITAGAMGWAMAPARAALPVNDVLAIYFLDPALASAFVR